MSIYQPPQKEDWINWGNQLKDKKVNFPDQRGHQEQLRDLMAIANRLQMYDAADYLQGILKG
jgi:hypothetical protein